jgi:acetyl-CoA carboxylase biotin carboxyl carrier protein
VELKQIKELIALMDKAGLKKIRIKDKDKYEIELEKQDENIHPAPQATSVHPDFQHKFHEPHPAPRHPHHLETPKTEKVDGKFITAPLVGTVYHASSPEDAPFVKVGDRVDENTVVCIIEAMKVMNEVKAGMSGTVAEVLVKNAHPVEFGAQLIRIV